MTKGTLEQQYDEEQGRSLETTPLIADTLSKCGQFKKTHSNLIKYATGACCAASSLGAIFLMLWGVCQATNNCDIGSNATVPGIGPWS